jgi:hypothetical protein
MRPEISLFEQHKRDVNIFAVDPQQELQNSAVECGVYWLSLILILN